MARYIDSEKYPCKTCGITDCQSKCITYYKWLNGCDYDVEKVVECIHEYFLQKIDDCEEDIIPHEILEYNKAICEIVRKGGVE